MNELINGQGVKTLASILATTAPGREWPDLGLAAATLDGRATRTSTSDAWQAKGRGLISRGQ